MDLSIIIVSWNTRELLRNCLASLPAACGDFTHEVLVVDNASSDGSAAMVAEEFPACRLLPGGGNLGFSRGNNLALPQTTGQAVLLLNPDTVCPPDSLAKLFCFAGQIDRAGAVGPRLIDGQGRPTLTYGFFPAAWHHWLGALDPWRVLPVPAWQRRGMWIPQASESSHPVDYVSGACLLMPRTALEQVGGLDEQFFMYFEETDWCLRARKAGLEVWYCAETEIVHLEGQAAGKADQFTLRQFQLSYRLFLAKHLGRRRIWNFRLAQLAEYSLKALWRSLAPGDRRRNRDLARRFRQTAGLQCEQNIAANPPD